MYSDIIKISAFVLIQYKIDCTLILCKIMLKMKPGKQNDPWQLPPCSLVPFSVPDMLEVWQDAREGLIRPQFFTNSANLGVVHQSPTQYRLLFLPPSFPPIWEVLMVSHGCGPPQMWGLEGWCHRVLQFLPLPGNWLFKGHAFPLNLRSALAEWEKVLTEVPSKLLLYALLTRACRAAQINHCALTHLGIKKKSIFALLKKRKYACLVVGKIGVAAWRLKEDWQKFEEGGQWLPHG